jgi:hypothetical protein
MKPVFLFAFINPEKSGVAIRDRTGSDPKVGEKVILLVIV